MNKPLIADPNTILRQVFGYSEFRDGQDEVINQVLNGFDVLSVMATGSGKSLCYQIPALCLEGVTLVVSPLISLMKDQVDELQLAGVNSAFINSSQSFDEQNSIIQDVINNNIKLLYVSPEKLISSQFLNYFPIHKINVIAIDEAHCISQWGHNFRPEYQKLSNIRQFFINVPIIALTATADLNTRNDIINALKLHNPFVYIGSFDRPNIDYKVQAKYNPTAQLVDYVKSQKGKSGIIYCSSRKKVEKLKDTLQKQGIKALAYHAGMTNEERASVQNMFHRDNAQVIVATVAFGMGINKSNIRFVLHFDTPRSIENYYQETGRAGRDNLSAEAVLFYDPDDLIWIRKSITEKESDLARDLELHKLEAMEDFVNSQSCRRQVLLNYFGESLEKNCGNCDICLSPPQKYDALIPAQKIISAIYRTFKISGEYFGVNYLIALLRGVNNQKIFDNEHHNLSVFGIGSDLSTEYWKSLIRELIHLGFIHQHFDYAQNHIRILLTLTDKSAHILKQQTEFLLPKPRFDVAKSHHKQTASLTDRELLKQLIFIRKQISDSLNIKPDSVFNDVTLNEMVKNKPITEDQMLTLSGITQTKFNNFGDKFIELIKKYHN